MDRNQFDGLSRLVAAGESRRDALRLLLGGAVAGAAVGVVGAAAKGTRTRQSTRSKTRAARQTPLCPPTCNQNCDNKPIHGGVNLSKCNLSDRDLDGVNLGGSNLDKACFEGASLRNVSFRGANVLGACFCNADLRGADFRGSNLTPKHLACAKPGCDTILPSGKKAIVCGKNETCCNGICVNTRTDPDNCGVCGRGCGVCQGCAGGACEDLPDGLFDCTGQPLVPFGPTNYCQAGLCTASNQTGICDGGQCNCGPLGAYDPDTSTCGCNEEGLGVCNEIRPRGCCEIAATCLANDEYCNRLTCIEPPCIPFPP
ncbi:MAG: pentapeptide repeat-containing protein [Thermomicrobiales bacterium]